MVRSEQKMDIDSKKKVASDPDQEYIYFIGLKTIPSTCYILSDESSIPFYGEFLYFHLYGEILDGLSPKFKCGTSRGKILCLQSCLLTFTLPTAPPGNPVHLAETSILSAHLHG